MVEPSPDLYRPFEIVRVSAKTLRFRADLPDRPGPGSGHLLVHRFERAQESPQTVPGVRHPLGQNDSDPASVQGDAGRQAQVGPAKAVQAQGRRRASILAGPPATGFGALGGLAAQVKQVVGPKVQGQDRLVGGEGIPGRGALTRWTTAVVLFAPGGRGELGLQGGRGASLPPGWC